MSKYSCVIINGRFLEQKVTGVQRFAYETVCALDNLITDQTLPFILAIPPDVDSSKLPSFKRIQVKIIGKRKGILWAQTDLSRLIRKSNGLGLHLCNAVPLLNPKGVVCLHDISYTLHPEFVSTQKHKLIKIWHLIQNKVSSKKSLSVLTVSNWSKKEICQAYKIPQNKVTVVYNGWQHFNTSYPQNVTLEKFPFLKTKNFFYSMSSLGKNKNFDWIVEEARKNPDKIFAVAGSNDLKKYGSTLLGNSELKNLHYLGYVSDDEAKMLMRECRAFIFPSIYEGFGIPPLEALAMGAQVICSSASCLPEIFKDSVHYIDPYKHDKDIDSLLEENVHPAEEVLDLYSWEKTAKLTLNVLDSITNKIGE